MKIGIVGHAIKNTFGVGTPYMDWLSQWGNPFIIPPGVTAEAVAEMFDLVILPGGTDISPVCYGQHAGYQTGRSDPFFQSFDGLVLPGLIELQVPIFGICRGLQALNIAFGGTLHQDLYGHPYSTRSRAERVHSIQVEQRSVEVNSLHHQGIDTLGEGLQSLAVSEDNVVEAIRHQSLPIAAVQWHPEELWDSVAVQLLQEIV